MAPRETTWLRTKLATTKFIYICFLLLLLTFYPFHIIISKQFGSKVALIPVNICYSTFLFILTLILFYIFLMLS